MSTERQAGEDFKGNKDPSNVGANNLVTMAALLLVIGAILLIVGLIGSTERVGYTTVHVTNLWLSLAGGALAFLGVEAFIGLSLFWAWRHEHRGLAKA